MASHRRSRESPAPIVTGALVLANVAVYFLERALAAGGVDACGAYGLVPARLIATGEVTPIVTSLFMHDPSNVVHIGGNMLALVLFGSLVERALGPARFAMLYLASGIGGALTHVIVDSTATNALVGASGCLFGVLAVSAVLRPRLLGFVASMATFNIVSLVLGTGGATSVACHVGGFSVGFAMTLLFVRLPGREVRWARAA